jgi:hypothetical protein
VDLGFTVAISITTIPTTIIITTITTTTLGDIQVVVLPLPVLLEKILLCQVSKRKIPIPTTTTTTTITTIT